MIHSDRIKLTNVLSMVNKRDLLPLDHSLMFYRAQ